MVDIKFDTFNLLGVENLEDVIVWRKCVGI